MAALQFEDQYDTGVAMANEGSNDDTHDDSKKDVNWDIELLEKYKDFAEELLKVSFAVVALLGFFLDKVASASYFQLSCRKLIAILLVLAAGLFVVSGVAALAHRLIGLGAASLAVRSVRRSRAGEATEAEKDRLKARYGYKFSSLNLGAAGLFAIIGAVVLLATLVVVGQSFQPKA